MEVLFAILTLGAAIGYAVFLGVNIEKGKPWALDIARAISVLDPNSVDQYLYVKRPEEDERIEKTAQPPSDRLAA